MLEGFFQSATLIADQCILTAAGPAVRICTGCSGGGVPPSTLCEWENLLAYLLA